MRDQRHDFDFRFALALARGQRGKTLVGPVVIRIYLECARVVGGRAIVVALRGMNVAAVGEGHIERGIIEVDRRGAVGDRAIVIARMMVGHAAIIVPERVLRLALDGLGAGRYRPVISVIVEILEAVLHRVGVGGRGRQNQSEPERYEPAHFCPLHDASFAHGISSADTDPASAVVRVRYREEVLDNA
jgi:hypothetical protein